MRMVIYLLVLLGVVAWKFMPRPWRPASPGNSAYLIFSSAPRSRQKIGQALELLYNAYSNHFGGLAQFQREHPKLKVKLFKDRDEFNGSIRGWAGRRRFIGSHTVGLTIRARRNQPLPLDVA